MIGRYCAEVSSARHCKGRHQQLWDRVSAMLVPHGAFLCPLTCQRRSLRIMGGLMCSCRSSLPLLCNSASYDNLIEDPKGITKCGKNGILTPEELLFYVVSPHIASAPCVSRVSHVYASIPRSLSHVLGDKCHLPSWAVDDTRRWLRNQFGTFGSALRRLHVTDPSEHWGIYLSPEQDYVVKAYCQGEADGVFERASLLSCGNSSSEASTACISQHRTSWCERENLLEVFQPVFPNFKPPPPPAQYQRHRSLSKKRKGHVPEGMLTPQMLVPYIPTFFIPVTELLSELPDGYTVEHLEGLFGVTGALEIVELEGEKFVRMHGGKCLLDFARDGAGLIAHDRWCEYQPDPFLCESFCRVMRGRAQWVSLRNLIEGSPPALVEALLPWRNYKTILFFAQMQHVFCFTPRGEGEVCCPSSIVSLSYHDSPTPAVVSELVRLLSGQRVHVADLQASGRRGGEGSCISDYAKTQILMYYGTLSNFFRVHGEVFYMEDGTHVGLLSDKQTQTRATRTLVDKLEDALLKKDRRTAQKLRRRIALEQNPDSPYMDREVLLDAILRYIPRKRSISLSFLLKSLPHSLTDFLPHRPVSLFQQFPEKVRIFEYRYRNRLHIIRPGVPLPSGVLRETYTEQELLFLCAAEVQQQPRFAVDVYGRLPYGAKEVIRLQYKGMLELLRPYPQYFTVIFQDAIRLDTRRALISLIQMPPAVQLTQDDYGTLVPEGAALQELEAEDREALETLPQEIRDMMNLNSVKQGDF
uniref:Uncharacterized protein n=1 Tax=Trypanosoma congolense (strain IL3000) TaxID=1068625 RepID=G0UQ52_TRYCI|nr:conserved hypothetical protein [Trypanosoma congolense IL3000]